MNGKLWFWIAVFFMFAIGMCSSNCGGDSGSSAVAAESNAETGIAQEFCIETWRGFLVTARTGEDSGNCENTNGEPVPIRITHDYEEQFDIYGNFGDEYCFAVERVSGYISISRGNGELARDGNLWTWCVTTDGVDPETMVVRSFTPASDILFSEL